MPGLLRRRSLSRLFLLLSIAFVCRLLFFSNPSVPLPSNTFNTSRSHEIEPHSFFQRGSKSLNVQKHKFLQARIGRDRDQLHGEVLEQTIRNGVRDYWERFQWPYIISRETQNRDTTHVLSAIDQLLSLNGWVAAACPTLVRPFGQNKQEDAYDDLIREDHLYYIAIVVHSADHFLIDQLAVIVQLAKRLGNQNLFVSMLDYDSSDSTETLIDLCEAVLTLLSVPFRIRRVPAMTEDPSAAYYPLEEAHMKNLALEPLRELHAKRRIKFKRVIWLKGFTCPNDILETIKISFANEAAMVCGMDWAQHNGFFIFSDRWRTRDIEGDQFRQAKSSSKLDDTVPPRDRLGASRYTQHLPFQVFCCEAGTHVVDPEQSYYKDIHYRAGTDFHNHTRGDPPKVRSGDAPCLDSSQAWFCRDLWIKSAKDAMDEVDLANEIPGMKFKRNDDHYTSELKKRALDEEPVIPDENVDKRQAPPGLAIIPDAGAAKPLDADANAGSDYDAMPEDEGGEDVPQIVDTGPLSIPNSVFHPARILVNPRCATTYAGVSHTQLARDLFGDGEDDGDTRSGKYVLDDWDGAPESFVCQEQRQTGGRKATKTQRRLKFSLHEELQKLS